MPGWSTASTSATRAAARQWVFANYNWFQEVQFAGLGAPAESGGFTGLASNSLIRSGGNRFSGLFETLYQNKGMTSDNISDEVLAENPSLTADKLDYVTDTTAQIGGPFKKDKLWFFTSFQYYRPQSSPNGYPPPGTDVGIGPSQRKEHSPRFIFKPTVRLGAADQLTGFFEWEDYQVEGRGAASNVAPEATLKQTGPGVAWNANYTKVLSSSSLFDIRYGGFDGYFQLDPYNGKDTMGWYDDDTDFYSVNSYFYLRSDRQRHQVNTSLTRFASGFAGEHNLKFGAEFERSFAKTTNTYPGGGYVTVFDGYPFAYLGGDYVLDGTNNRVSLFVQDSWRVGKRLTIEPGLRFDMHRGSLRNFDGSSFDNPVLNTNVFGPRIGFAFDLTGKTKTVLRGHYGRYFDGAKTTYFTLLADREPVFGAYIDPVTLQPLDDPYLIDRGISQTTIDDDLKHPKMDQFILGVEHELFRDFAVGANFIYRKNSDFIDDVLTNGVFTATTRLDRGEDNVAGTADDGTLTVYNQLNDPADDAFLITNPDSLYRKYRAVELSANKRLSDRWMVQASWVISKITGTIGNGNQLGNSIELDAPNYDPAFAAFQRRTLDVATIRTSPRSSGPIRRRGTSTCQGRTSIPPEAPTLGWSDSPTSIRRPPTSSPSRAGRGASMASRSSTSRLRSGSGWQRWHLRHLVRRLQPVQQRGGERPVRPNRRELQPTRWCSGAATTAVRSDLPLLIATAVQRRSPLLFREAGFFVTLVIRRDP